VSRSLTGGVASAVADPSVIGAHLVEMQFGSGTVRLTDLPYDIVWNGNTWTGLGHLGSIEPVRESAQSEATGLRFTLAGPIAAYLSLALQEQLQGDPVLLYIAFFDGNQQIIADPVLEWSGRADSMTIQDGDETSAISVSAESRYADFARPRIRRFSDADQQAVYPGDRFFQFLPQMVEKTISWPSRQFFER
jgi:hypothetical protein